MGNLSELYIVDEEYTDMAETYQIAIEGIKHNFAEFNIRVQNMVSCCVIQGDCALKLDEFVSVGKQALGTKYADAMDDHSREMTAYVNEIDAADDVLY